MCIWTTFLPHFSLSLSFSLSLVNASCSRPRDRRCVIVVVATTTVAARAGTPSYTPRPASIMHLITYQHVRPLTIQTPMQLEKNPNNPPVNGTGGYPDPTVQDTIN